MGLEFAGVNYAHEFFSYLESEDDLTNIEPLALDVGIYEAMCHFAAKNKGLMILATIMCIEWPKSIITRMFEKVLSNFCGKVNYSQETLIHMKHMRTSSATNKTISEVKF